MSLRIRHLFAAAAVSASLLLPVSAQAFSIDFEAGDGTGRMATADFTVSGDALSIVLTNTTTAAGTGAGDLLTSVAFDLGGPGILGGGASITAGSTALGFSAPGGDVSQEWGFGNNGQCCVDAVGTQTDMLLPNFVSTNIAGATPFQSGSLFGPPVLNGPSGGLAGSSYAGALEAVQTSVTFDLDLSQSLTQAELDALLDEKGAVFEWGSDEFPGEDEPPPSVPEPGAAAAFLVGAALVGGALRRSRRA